METPQEEYNEPSNLRLLRRLITILLITMIIGFVVLIFLFVMRFSKIPKTLELPSEISLPKGVTPSSFTQGIDWYGIVTTDDTILIYNRSDNKLRKTIILK